MEALPILRDLAIVIIAVESIILQGLLIVVILQARQFGKTVAPYVHTITNSTNSIVGTAQETAQTVSETAKTTKGTVGFVADRAARPVIELYATMAGASRFARAVVRRDSQAAGDTRDETP